MNAKWLGNLLLKRRSWCIVSVLQTEPIKLEKLIKNENLTQALESTSIVHILVWTCPLLKFRHKVAWRYWGPRHTRDWEPVTSTPQALSLVEKAEPVQVCFTLGLRDQRSMWKQDGCRVYMDSYIASNGSCFMVTWAIFKNHLLEVSLTQIQETMALWMLIIVILHFLSCVRTCMNRNSLKWHYVKGSVTYDFTLHSRVCDHTTTWFWRCVGTVFQHFLLGCHNFMVAALACVWSGHEALK